jgi:hypothetical protein
MTAIGQVKQINYEDQAVLGKFLVGKTISDTDYQAEFTGVVKVDDLTVADDATVTGDLSAATATVTGLTTTGTVKVGGGTTVKKILVGAAAVAREAADVAATAAEGVDVTVTGAALGDLAVPVCNIAVPDNLALSATVKAENTVTVKIINPTAGAIALGAATFNALVIDIT